MLAALGFRRIGMIVARDVDGPGVFRGPDEWLNEFAVAPIATDVWSSADGTVIATRSHWIDGPILQLLSRDADGTRSRPCVAPSGPR